MKIQVTVANENDWVFVFHKHSLHMHDKRICGKCGVWAVF